MKIGILCTTIAAMGVGCIDGGKGGGDTGGTDYWRWHTCYVISYDLCADKMSAGLFGEGDERMDNLIACHETLTTQCVDDLNGGGCEPAEADDLNTYYGYTWDVGDIDDDPVCPDAISQNILAPDEIDSADERMYWAGRLPGMLADIPVALHPSILKLCPCLCDREITLDGDYEEWQPPYGKVCTNMTYTEEDLETPIPGF